MTCENARPLVTAYVDGELDMVNSLAVEEHLSGCPACARARDAQRELRSALAGGGLRYTAPADLRRKVRAIAPEPRRAWFSPWLGKAWLAPAFAALIVVAGAVWLRPQPERVLGAEITAAHVRSLQAAHLLDVPSSDRHTVKPWFAGKLDFSPAVPDLGDKGFPLSGGRLDYIQGRSVAVLVYLRNKHVINVFVWPGSSSSGELATNGYNVVHWSHGGMTYWAVSDLNETELKEFSKLLE